ncbi:MAG: helix-turn-helix transcriptional regulator [Patescibacteria group bacterium]|nr:helix-turn-helix transcriptional regulator [Patescibacteria group bacterium]
MTSQVLSHRMMGTSEAQRLRFALVAAEFLERMGDRLRERREEMGLSRGEVARRMSGKVNENQIYRWENGKHQPNPDTLEELARVLEREVSYFMTPALRPSAELGGTPEPSLQEMAQQLGNIEALVSQLLERLVAADVIAAVDADTQPKPQRAPRARRTRAA